MGSLRSIKTEAHEEEIYRLAIKLQAFENFYTKFYAKRADPESTVIGWDEIQAHALFYLHLSRFVQERERYCKISLHDHGDTILVMTHREGAGLSGYTVDRYSGDIHAGSHVTGSIFDFKG